MTGPSFSTMSNEIVTLSRATRLLVFAGAPCLLSAILFMSPITAASLPLLALPTLFLLRYRTRSPPAERSDLETLIWTFVISGTVGVGSVAAIQSVLAYTFALLLFGRRTDEYLEEFGRTATDGISADDRRRRAAMAWTWEYLVMLLLFAFVMAAFLEEMMKYVAGSYIRRRRTKLQAHEYIGYIVAASLGFSTIENIGFVYASATGGDSLHITAITIIERVIIAMPGHALMGVLTAINMIRRDLQKVPLKTWQTVYASILYHGTFDFAMLGASAMEGNVGWVHPTKPSRILLLLALASSMMATLIWHARQAYRKSIAG